MSSSLTPPRTLSLIKNILITFGILIYWSFFAIMDAIYRPFEELFNPFIPPLPTPANLGVSILNEIITSYFSLFALSQLIFLLLWFAMYHSLSIALLGLVNPLAMAESHKQKTFSFASKLQKINFNEIVSINKDGDYQIKEKTFSSGEIVIPEKMAAVAKDKYGNPFVLIGGTNKSATYSMDIGGSWIAVLPLRKNIMKIQIDLPQFNKQAIKERYWLSYGFPRKTGEEGNTFDADTLIRISEKSDFSTWRRLVELLILTGMADFGFSIKQKKSEEGDLIHLEYPLTSQIFSAADSDPTTVIKRKVINRIFLHTGKKFANKGKSRFRRNRKFSIIPHQDFTTTHYIDQKPEFITDKLVDPQNLQTRLNDFVNFNMHDLYDCPAVELEITER